MTYQELKSRLEKCEYALKSIKDGTHKNINTIDVQQTTEKLTLLKESLIKQMNALEEGNSKTYLVTPKSGQTSAVSMSDDEIDALKDADDVKGIKGVDGEEIKENVEFSIDETKAIAKKVGAAVARSLKSLGDDVASMKAKNIEVNSFEIYVQYKNGKDDEFSFYIGNNKLVLQDFTFTKELVDVGVKPSGEPIINVDVLTNELNKHFKSLEENVDEGYYDNYKPKHFDICPGAETLRKRVLDGEFGEQEPVVVGKWTELHDELFAIEKLAIKKNFAQDAHVREANDRREQIIQLSREMNIPEEAIGYLKGHVDKIIDIGKKSGGIKEVDEYNSGIYYDDEKTKPRPRVKVKKEGAGKHYIKVPKAEYQPTMQVIDNNAYGDDVADIVDDDGAGNVIIYFKHDENLYDLVMDLGGYDIDVVDHTSDAFHYNDDVDEARDLNDPALMKFRAAKIAAKKKAAQRADDRMAKAIGDNPYNSRKDSLVAKLKAMRAQIMRDMEQEAEPEGGPVADAYGEKLNKIDAAIAKATGKKEPTYGLTKEEDGDYEYKGKHQGTNYKWPMSDYMKRRKEADDYYEDPDYYKEGKGVNERLVKGFNPGEKYYLPDDGYMAAKLRAEDEWYTPYEGEDADGETTADRAFHTIRYQMGIKDPEKIKKFVAGWEKYTREVLDGTTKLVQNPDNAPSDEPSKNNVVWNWSGDRNELEQVPPKFKAAVKKGLGDKISDFEAAFDAVKNSFADEAGRGGMKFNSDDWIGTIEMDHLNEDMDIGHQDDEPDMLKQHAYDIAQYAAKLYKALDKYDKYDGEVDFPNWWQSKLILARDYISKAQHYLEFEEKQPAIDQLALEGKYKSDAQRKAIYATKAEKGELKEVTEDQVQDAIQELRDLIDEIESKGEEAREVVRQVFPNELSRLDAYGAFSNMYSANRYDVTLGGFVDRLEEEGFEIEDGEVFTNESFGKTKKAYDLVVSKMKELAKQYKAGDKSVINQLKDLTAKKKKLEAMLDNEAGDIGAGQELDSSIDEATDLYDRNGIQITRFSGGKRGLMVQINYGGKYIHVPADEFATLARAMQSVIGDIRDMTLQMPRKNYPKNEAELDKKEKKQVKKIVKQLKKSVKGHGDQAKYLDKLSKESAPGYKHDCASKVVHEKYGEGTCIPEKHTLVKEGNKYVVTHYDVLFENGNTVLDIPVSELEIKTQTEHWHKGYKKKKK